MKSLLESIRLQMLDRLSSPLFGAFAISWLAWNHQYLLILFSDEQVMDRLELAQTRIFPNYCAIGLRGIVYPLLSSVCFILVYPLLSRLLFKYWHKQQLEMKKDRDQIEGATLLTIEESRKIRVSMVEAQTEFEEKVRQQAEIIDALKKELQAKKQKESPPLAPMVPLPTSQGTAAKLDSNCVMMLRLITDEGGQLIESKLFSSFKESPIRLRYCVDRLKEKQLVNRVPLIGVDDYMLELTEKGRKYVVEEKII